MSRIHLWNRVTQRAAVRLFLAAVAGGVLLLSAAPGAGASTFERRPVLFVHGFESAGSNFASQAMRLESNGYPPSWVEEIDYNSTLAVTNQTQVEKQIEEAIASLKQRTGKSQVDVIGHSEGTSVMYHYLAEAAQAAEHRASVARYVNLDGQEKNPGVPTLALWAERSGPTGPSGRHMEGAENVTIPNQTHVQSSTSTQSFEQIYKFFRGTLPAHDIVPQIGTITLAGKALEFPQNSGLIGDTLQIWPLNFNGVRTTATPLASILITDGSTGGGAWGPVAAKAGQRYEFALLKPGAKALHTYMEPFVRSDYAIRLLGSIPIEQYTGKYPKSSGAVMIRYKEYWGNEPGQNDALLVNRLNVCTAALCPWEKKVNAFFAFNWEGREETTLKEDPVLSKLPFIQGAQVYIPASSPPNATVSYQLNSRGGGGVRTLNIPNWEGVTDQVQIFWNDFETPRAVSSESCHEGDGSGEIGAAQSGTASFTFDADQCDDGAPEGVSERDPSAGTDFHSTQVQSVAFDDVAHSVTVTGLGTNNGLPVAFVMTAVDSTLVPGGLYSLVLSDGYSRSGTLSTGVVKLH